MKTNQLGQTTRYARWAVCFALLTIVSGCNHSEDDSSLSTERVVFTVNPDNRGGTVELYSATADGSEIDRIDTGTITQGFVTNFQVSPDRRWVAYHATHDSTHVGLYVNSIGGGDKLRITRELDTGAGHFIPMEWSPDSSMIAYIALEGAPQRDLYAATIDGQSYARVNGDLSNGGRVTDFRWLPDSAKLTYTADQDVYDRVDLHTGNADGSENLKLNAIGATGSGLFLPFVANPSPDGTIVSYVSTQDEHNVIELYASTIDGLLNWKINEPMVMYGDIYYSGVWSPDSSSIAYLADQNQDQVPEVFIGLVDGSAVFPVSGPMTQNIFHQVQMIWSPDGQWLAYTAANQFDNRVMLYVSSRDGSTVTKVGGPLKIGTLPVIKWAPDSSGLVFEVLPDGNPPSALYFAAHDGSELAMISRPLLGGGYFFIPEVQWSPDSNEIAYIAPQDDINVDSLYVASKDGVQNTRVSDTINLRSSIKQGLRWSNDGSALMFVGRDVGAPAYSLYANRREGGLPWKISGEFAVLDTDLVFR